ncbi:MAG: outer membrane beta-barrel protein [Chloracidobacterium sp.]|uniref:Outer membrane beta-barrel protein n=1 Tax=Chloracidobacterium validum TaxID=2821543 RepID=A0ABX8B875_9BACT|nr:outer membrane beta-barrel protein [Chloracidobacterium validum]QUW03146.1 outer membrane beta-barrel protein [Chloracidobacterium validum]
MKKLIWLAFAAFCFSAVSYAQSTPSGRADVYGTYTFQNNRSNGDSLNANGFSVGTNLWLTKSFGINGEYTFGTGNRDASLTVGTPPTTVTADLRARYNTFVAGPVYRFNPDGRVEPFVRALFGATRVSTRFSTNVPAVPRIEDDATSFTFIGGGGLDVNLTQSKRVAFRLVSVDYQFIRDNRIADSQNGVRVSTGLIIRF